MSTRRDLFAFEYIIIVFNHLFFLRRGALIAKHKLKRNETDDKNERHFFSLYFFLQVKSQQRMWQGNLLTNILNGH